MGGSLAPVRVAGFTWNGWQPSAVYAVNANEWKSERERYDAAWAKYQNVAERIDAKYESLDSGTQDQTPAQEDLSELQEAWEELENARQRLGEYMNEFHERHMAQGKSM